MDEAQLKEKVKLLEARVEELESIISIMPGHIYWLDKNNVFQGCNLEQAASAKLSSPTEIIGKTNYDMIWKDQAAGLDAVNTKVMQTGQRYLCEEVALMAGGLRTYLSQKVPIRNKKGEITGLLGISFDITERKHMEEELQEAKEKAELANQVKTEFIRNMEHDIRTPLCGIAGVAAYLKTKIEPPLKEFLLDIEVSSNELLNYFNTINELSRLHSEASVSVTSSFNIRDIVKTIYNMELPAAKDNKLQLLVEHQEPNYVLLGDTFRISRALLNLVSNAIKFTHQGYVKIITQMQRVNANEGFLLISVIDTGIGISKKDQSIIFDKFTRCDLSNRGVYKGTGLGLWVAKQFMNDIGGKIEVVSEVNKGSIFSLAIPVKIAVSAEEDS